jgi:hypothetical protein
MKAEDFFKFFDEWATLDPAERESLLRSEEVRMQNKVSGKGNPFPVLAFIPKIHIGNDDKPILELIAIHDWIIGDMTFPATGAVDLSYFENLNRRA